jgi:hypothetical protein
MDLIDFRWFVDKDVKKGEFVQSHVWEKIKGTRDSKCGWTRTFGVVGRLRCKTDHDHNIFVTEMVRRIMVFITKIFGPIIKKLNANKPYIHRYRWNKEIYNMVNFE